MCSVLWALVLLLGSFMLQPALLGPTHHRRAGPLGWQDQLNGLKDYEIVVPRRVDMLGNPFSHQEHFLLRHKRERRSTEDFENSLHEPLNSTDAESNKSFETVESSLFYTLEAYGKKFELELHPFRDFIAPSILVQYTGSKESWIIADDDAGAHCFHEGKVSGDPASSVSLSVCHSLMGTIQAFDQRYIIEPHHNVSNSREGEETVGWDTFSKPHLLYRLSDTKHFTNTSTPCGLNDSLNNTPKKEKLFDKTPNDINDSYHRPTRRKRSIYDTSDRRWVEVMVAADEQMASFHKHDLQHYILTVMATVASIYRDFSIGNAINIVLVKIVVLQDESGPHLSSNAVDTLRNFCDWQSKENNLDDKSSDHYDTAVLLTRKDICRSQSKCDTLGLAELGTICDISKSCSIIEDNGLSAAFTVAHEIGHVFNLPHDDNISKCREHKGVYHVMAPTLDYNTNPWSWSNCSRKMLTEFLDSVDNNGGCLLDDPQQKRYLPKLLGAGVQQGGSAYNSSAQCERVFGEGYKICPYMESCSRLWCTTNSAVVGCRTQHMPWADGTECAPNKWCQRGKCVPQQTRTMVKGGWGQWSSFGNCTRTCGGGVKKSHRECNRPIPQHGGAYCQGRRVKYRSCNTHECESQLMDFREEQCAKFDGKHFNINGLSTNTRWVPKYDNIGPHDRCKLFCQAVGSNAYYRLKNKVIDGTKCDRDTSDICVNGRCWLAGCDNRLGSTTKRDKCGVCGGRDEDCFTISASFHQDVRYGYNHVARIPKGASNLDIRQVGQAMGEDDNYLALRNSTDGFILNGLLNGNFVVSKFRKDVKVKGSILQYSGSNAKVERINGSRILQEELDLMVLSVGDLKDPNIEYSYTMSKNTISVRWDRKGRWEACSRTTCGFQQRALRCRRNDNGKVVPNHNCSHLTNKPTQIQRQCNNHHCHAYSWHVDEVSPCSVSCGTGKSRRKVRCYSRRKTVVEDSRCIRARKAKPSEEVVCSPGPCFGSRWFYKEWSKCSKSCGGGLQKRRVLCLNQKNNLVNEEECEATDRLMDTQDCNSEPCPVWRAGDWTRCSVTCGGGWKQRSVNCYREDVTESKLLCNRREEPDTRMPCSVEACPAWSSGTWGPCSVTCGTGVQLRAVKCRSANGDMLRDGDCNLALQPSYKRICAVQPCIFNYAVRTINNNFFRSTTSTKTSTPSTTLADNQLRPQWRTGSWTECSQTCGFGTRQRYVSCRDKDGQTADQSGCTGQPKPASQEKCKIASCGEWRTGEWARCSKTCGEGSETRLVACILLDELEEQIANPQECDLSIKPISERICNNIDSCVPISKFPISSISTNSVVGTAHWREGPWGRCSLSCGNGWMRRKVVCQDENGSSDNCDPSTRPSDLKSCYSGPCPRWNYGNWGQCTRSCGGNGVQRRVVICQLPNGMRQDEDSCPQDSRPANQQECGRKACTSAPRWEKSRWSTYPGTRLYQYYESKRNSLHENNSTDIQELKSNSILETSQSGCSVTCGRGRKTRSVGCVDQDGNPLQDSKCKHRRPRDVKHCRQGRCPRWKTSSWSKCSASCGEGTRQRKAKCVRNKGRTVEPKLCEHIPQPNQTEPCTVRKCEPYYWSTGRWSQCSTSCSYGVKYRKVMCLQMSTGKAVDEGYCDRDKKPRSKKQCSHPPCQFIWREGDWGQCSEKCGVGYMSRSISCHRVTPEGWILPDPVTSGCNMRDRPELTQPCNNGYCDSEFLWEVGEWDTCSKECGYGTTRRKVQCINRHRKRHHRRNCPEAYKPEHVKVCYRGPCYASTCRELKHLSSVQRDGNYNLLVSGHLVQIYCSGMNTSHPKEYLSLSTAEKDNYSEKFSKRLRKAATCPAVDARSPSCPECLRSRDYSKSGLTYFSRVRLNITSLQVIANDFLYSSSQGAKNIPFATAGDCYSSSASCPKGQFKIDLTDTSFRVSRKQQWHNYGFQTSTKISISQDGQVVEGRCGGFCGGCMPPAESGLLLEVLT